MFCNIRIFSLKSCLQIMIFIFFFRYSVKHDEVSSYILQVKVNQLLYIVFPLIGARPQIGASL